MVKRKQNVEQEHDEADETAVDSKPTHKRGPQEYWVCGHYVASDEDRRIVMKPTIGQAKKYLQTCKEIVGDDYDSFWLEKVKRIEV